ncbi:MAG: hypothetical protein IJO51_00355 [Clostridia bacterium]|nr:hypothetical protein [Clostridia bacterium]MBQ9924449.1 hypothetical protein [Clostridia bacterium]
MEPPKRKTIRLKTQDYDAPGKYFITICVKNKEKLLGQISVGTGVLDGPKNQLSLYGKIADRQLQRMAAFYEDIQLEKYVIMPNHIHLLLDIPDLEDGPSGRPVPTQLPVHQNSKVSRFVGTFKRFCNRWYGCNIWQARSYDHVIRGEKDYLKIWDYIENNPAKWTEDRLYTE